MKTKLSTIAVVLTLTLLPSAANASTILATGSSWEYTFTDPTGDATWNTTTGSVGWLTGLAPFGNHCCNGDGFDFVTPWPADGDLDDDLWVKTAVDFTGFDLSTITWNLGVDNGFKLYLNGSLIDSDNAEGYTSQWEYTGAFGAAAVPGINIVAVALEDHGGLTAFDMEINGTAAVPDVASTLTLLVTGIGLLGIGYKRSR
jgi:hypothetical protein